MIEGLVSTIIPAFNRSSMLAEAVASVMAQSYRPIEIIISDDGSTDDTPEVSRALASAHPEVVRVVRNPNRGPGPAREAGRLLARGEFIQYLDSDDRLLPNKFECQVAALRADPDSGIAYGLTRLIDVRGAPLAEPYKWTAERREALFPGLLVDRWWCTHTPLYRRTITDAIGPWSDLRYSQDWEYDARAGAMSVRLAHCPEYVSEHRHHAGVRQTSEGKWLATADRVRFFGALLEGAGKAGVPRDAPERRHFARWVFAHARQCGSAGDARAAEALCAIAARAHDGRDLGLKGYRLLARVLGWSITARVGEKAHAWLGRRTGSDSMRQSWMP